jgi:hypothetical protein
MLLERKQPTIESKGFIIIIITTIVIIIKNFSRLVLQRWKKAFGLGRRI